MTKQEIFKESMARLKKKEEELYKREPERKLYDEGKITWSEYLKRAKVREEKERKEKNLKEIKPLNFMMQDLLLTMNFQKGMNKGEH
ncbi:hypothetical protein O6R05_05300 [Peptoniphilus equinus]|uniref:Uncharacterized protein n=1 Tax=Peptoniphilus equinus TaxID=3016343 RepID=A0ABY7QSW6_9FIRM|nr:hypothetical protein [Peptoniphilus equinus]WBW49426.1 hypothetical protein O6R05_05300 [Peptoniphilus equinus]